MEPIEARVYVPEVSPEMAEMIASGEFKGNMLDLADGKYTSEFAEKIKSLPRVEMTARPLKVPQILVDLPRDSEVIVRDGRGDSVEPVWLTLSRIESQIQRQARGFFELKEVAEILADSCASASGRPITPGEFDKDLTRAFFSGALPFFNERLTQMDFKNEKETFNFGWYGETTTPEAVNAWLEATGSPHRFPILKAENGAVPLVVADSASVTHSTKARRDILTPVIELAQKQCDNPKDAAEVWAVLAKLADEKKPPLRGATEDGLQYLKNGDVAIFKRGSLKKRLDR